MRYDTHENDTPEQDDYWYDQYLAWAGIPHVCLTCGERQQVDPNSASYRKFEVLCHCGKHCLPEDEITAELWGKLLCRRAGVIRYNRNIQGHVWHYIREREARNG